MTRAGESLRLGCVKYLNARPLIAGWDGDVLFDHPATLCDQLSRAELDVALVSSFEFLRNPIYRIVEGVSVASAGAVYSVFVAYRGNFRDVREIELDPSSRTSVNLLRCLLGELNLNPKFISAPTAASGDLAAGTAKLVIGDQGIRFRQGETAQYKFLDLGEEWSRITGLPFVFALWLVRPEVSDATAIADKLRERMRRNVARLDELAGRQTEFEPAFCARYFKEHLHFGFADLEKKGLLAFHRLCQKHRGLPPGTVELQLV